MTSAGESDELLGMDNTAVCKQLEQIFPNHHESVIKNTVQNISKQWGSPENCLERCIEELVSICPFESQRKGTVKPGRNAKMSVLQKNVLDQLKPIFPNYSMKILRTAVCHPSNQTEPDTEPALLQRCIIDVLDGRTALDVNLCADDFQENISKIGNSEDVTITKVEEPKLSVRASTDETKDLISPNVANELQSVSDHVEIVTSLPTQQAELDTCPPSLKQPGCPINKPESQTVTCSLSTPVTVVKPVLKTGLTAATAHICIQEEKGHETDEPNVQQTVTKNTMKSEISNCLKPVVVDMKETLTSSIDKQTCDHNSASLSYPSFSISRRDMYSTNTIDDSSDSDSSFPAADSPDSQSSDDDALPKINFPKKIYRGSAFDNPRRFHDSLKPDGTSKTINIENRSDTLDKQVTVLHNPVSETKVTESDEPVVSTRPAVQSSADSFKDLLRGFKVKFGSSDSAPFPGLSFSRTPSTPQDETEGHAEGLVQTHSSLTPKKSQSHNCTWNPSNPVTNQQTVTIKSTHKIMYKNIVKENMMKQNINNNSEDISSADQSYSISTPKFTFQVPLDQQNIDFVSKWSKLRPSAVTREERKGSTLKASSTIYSKGHIEPDDQQTRHLPQFVPQQIPEVIPVTLSGTVPAQLPRRVIKNPAASHTAPNPDTNIDLAPIVIHDEPFKNDQEPETLPIFVQDDPVVDPILVPDDPVVGKTETPPEPVQSEIAEDPIVQVKNDVLNLFPDVDPDHLMTLCQEYKGPMAVNNICFAMLENNYPKKNQTSAVIEENKSESEMTTIDYYKDYHSVSIPDNIIVVYQAQAFQLLAKEFSWLSANDIRAVMRRVLYRYAPSHKALKTVWHQALEVAQKKKTTELSAVSFRGLVYQAKIPADEIGGLEQRIAIKLLKNRRPMVKTNFNIISELQREINFVEQKLKHKELEADYRVAFALNEQEYEDQGQCIECGCCFGEYPFEQMVQCYEGHLFCENCLRQYAKESVFGQGKADLKCMTELCDSLFPKSQLLKALPSEVLEKYEDRVTEENLNLADLGDLVKCPHCSFRAFMDPADKVFRCQSDSCKKETCRYCQVEWEEHFGKKCSEVEKKDETKLRLEYEEKMTMAKVRVCHRCKAQFMKLDGCNKMTCRCGAKMCYICRQPNIDYNHFCQHPRDPGKGCKKCQACSLWTNPEEDENRAVAEMQKEAEEERKKKGYTETKVIGVPSQPPAKKVKR